MATPKQTDPQFKLRLPAALKDEIEEAARTNNRTMNAEIVDRLEKYEAAQNLIASVRPDMARLSNAIEERQREINRLYEERSTIFKAMNDQERSLQSLREAHRTLSIVAKSLGEMILSDGDRSEMTRILATGLLDVEVDTSSDASEEIPKPFWDEYKIPPDFDE
ncbi:hypothetical protein NA8A_22356 [Nitratireductor indicus C115]|uniref:Arc-like DNA binding domain-containing protein n=1 Tax=Nitratireductor indicus C115 TaxID=1231190 RepID=K2MY68_9HYPH|nr:Arc family DNA-binding protein [Nitratireductor indicus]EKF40158.1 hypothetical protein NA8A_22356 [Nitratireductor indicus C115]SFQ80293.1 Arc-like DNA binding domain-containing protein [Nitratireductor indicus]